MRTGRHQPWLPLFANRVRVVAALGARDSARDSPWRGDIPVTRGMSMRTVRAVCLHLAAFAAVSAVAEAWSAALQMLFNPWGQRKWPTFMDTWTTSRLSRF